LAFNENSRVKIPALIHLEKLGYHYLSLKTLNWDKETNIITEILERKVQELNPSNSLQEIKLHLKQVLATLDNDDLGRAFYNHLTNQNGIKLIDLDDFHNNQFNCVTEFEFENDLDSFRPDINLLINGLPLVLIEVKKPNNKEGIGAEKSRMSVRLQNPKFKQIFNLTQIMVFSNNMEYDEENPNAIEGAFYSTVDSKESKFNFMREEIFDYNSAWLYPENSDVEFILEDNNLVQIKNTAEFEMNCQPTTPTHRLLTSLFDKNRLAFLLKYAICYTQTTKGIEKHIMRYPQLFATFALEDALDQGSKGGIIWHTQGSGKTALAFYNVRFLKDYYKKRNTVTKIYFVVDRLQLLKQAKSEFSMRGLKVNTINSKEEFLEDFTKTQAIANSSGQLEITVLNIQKFAEDAQDLFKKEYAVNIQRVFFIDEAHRSYKPTGSFFANLRSSDREAILICLTGTPLIGDEPSTKLFGSYIHKYYYNQSIADGYTLRLIREEIDTTFSSNLKSAITKIEEIEKGKLPRELVLAHKNFVKPILAYIVEDLARTRLLNGNPSIGGMIVCDSSEQAKELYRQISSDYPEQRAALILHDVGTKDDRDEESESFKAGELDFLIVYNMLLTGFDAPRLKKIYFGRVIKDHNLLQALTRVNRPYADFKYGYVVDFADITDEFNKTNAAYYSELTSEMGSEGEGYSELFVSKSEIEAKITEISETLFLYDLKNAETFSQQISKVSNTEEIRTVVKALNSARESYNLIKSMGYKELADRMDFRQLHVLHIEATNRLELVLLKERLDVSDQTKALLNSALEDIDFTFKKVSEKELEIGNKLKASIRKVRQALLKNFDEKDPEFISLYDELKRVLRKRNISESSSDDVERDVVILEEVFRKAQELHNKNLNLAHKYNGDVKFARIHKLIQSESSGLSVNKIFELLDNLRRQVNIIVSSNQAMLNNIEYFESEVRLMITRLFDQDSAIASSLDIDKVRIYVTTEYLREISEKEAA